VNAIVWPLTAIAVALAPIGWEFLYRLFTRQGQAR
jgi:hypothetical protein